MSVAWRANWFGARLSDRHPCPSFGLSSRRPLANKSSPKPRTLPVRAATATSRRAPTKSTTKSKPPRTNNVRKRGVKPSKPSKPAKLSRPSQLTKSPKAPKLPKPTKEEDIKGAKAGHFDEAIITVRAGAGGKGEIADKAGGRTVTNFKYRPGGSLPKKLWLPNSDPADGYEGSSIVLFVDPALDSLLHLHERSKWAAADGAQGNPLKGTHRPKTQAKQRWVSPPLRIPVPPGTVVRKKRGGVPIADLTHPGDSVVVARGGRGGMGVLRPTKQDNARMQQRKSRFLTEADTQVSEYIVEDDNWRADAEGGPGEEACLQLLLRVVADVGIVGFPNAGKSSLLAALTRASPEVAPYPFTTVTPNLGVTQVGDFSDFAASSRLVLADLPGLIEGAHQGRGLGRVFLRHLRRTRIILHVVDAAAEDPATDYWAVREELRLYNPDYCARPHIVALNKMDLQEASHLQEEITAEVQTMARKMMDSSPEGMPLPSLPSAIVCVSAQAMTGLDALNAALHPMLPERDLNTEQQPIIDETSEEDWGWSSSF